MENKYGVGYGREWYGNGPRLNESGAEDRKDDKRLNWAFRGEVLPAWDGEKIRGSTVNRAPDLMMCLHYAL
jgi:hypothetical protein